MSYLKVIDALLIQNRIGCLIHTAQFHWTTIQIKNIYLIES